MGWFSSEGQNQAIDCRLHRNTKVFHPFQLYFAPFSRLLHRIFNYKIHDYNFCTLIDRWELPGNFGFVVVRNLKSQRPAAIIYDMNIAHRQCAHKFEAIRLGSLGDIVADEKRCVKVFQFFCLVCHNFKSCFIIGNRIDQVRCTRVRCTRVRCNRCRVYLLPIAIPLITTGNQRYNQQ